MRTCLTAHDIANNVRMTRTLHKGTILIVEGDTDIRIYARFINENHCKVIPAHGKDNAISALTILEKDNFKGVLTIVDTDFWKLDSIKPNTVNVLLTDTHDLETMLLASPALEKVLSEFGSTFKIKALSKPIRDMLLAGALPIGFLRWLSNPSKDNLLLKFKELSFDGLIDKRTLGVNIDSLIIEVKNNSQNSTLDNNSIKLKILTLMTAGYDPWLVCSGHDLVQILTIGLINTFGNYRARTIAPEAVDGILRLSYEYSYFKSTQLYDSIKEWETTNSPFKILS